MLKALPLMLRIPAAEEGNQQSACIGYLIDDQYERPMNHESPQCLSAVVWVVITRMKPLTLELWSVMAIAQQPLPRLHETVCA